MAPRSSRVLRVSALAGVAVAVFRPLLSGGPAYAVKGAWHGEAGSLKSGGSEVLAGLEPEVAFPAISYGREGLSLGVEDGHVHADYSTKLDEDTTLSVRVNDERAWRASLVGDDAALRLRGDAFDLDSLSWDASKESSVEDVGDVKVEFNSDREYNLTVVRNLLASLAGFDLDAKVRATNAGITGRLGAHRELPKGAAVSYSVENPVGVYDLGSSKHEAQLSVPVAGGNAALKVLGDAEEQEYQGSYTRALQGGQARLEVNHAEGAVGYNVSYARGLEDVTPVDADVQLGVDDAGVYGKLGARRGLSDGLDAEYEAQGRFDFDGEDKASFAHALKLSNKLGFAQLRHGSGEAPRLRVGYEFEA